MLNTPNRIPEHKLNMFQRVQVNTASETEAGSVSEADSESHCVLIRRENITSHRTFHRSLVSPYIT